MSFTIGCDPEVTLRLNGVFTHAGQYFKSHSSMGLDGCESVAEIRPGYSESPIDLTCKIRTVLEYGFEKAPQLEFFSGHYVDEMPIGGHIHVGTAATPQIIDGLDTVLSSLSDCIDDKQQRSKRELTGYGKRRAYRTKSYGFEYRTPGSWLLSPSITLVTLTLAKLAVIGVQEDNLDFTEIKERRHSRSFLLSLKDHLLTIPEDCIEGLNEMRVLLSKTPINWNSNILPNWGFAYAA
jgi:hypothetical protein